MQTKYMTHMGRTLLRLFILVILVSVASPELSAQRRKRVVKRAQRTVVTKRTQQPTDTVAASKATIAEASVRSDSTQTEPDSTRMTPDSLQRVVEPLRGDSTALAPDSLARPVEPSAEEASSEDAASASLLGRPIAQVMLSEIENCLHDYDLATATDLITRYIDKHFPDRANITPEAAALETRVLRAQRMLQSVERVELLDSLRTSKALIYPQATLQPADRWDLKQAYAMIRGFMDKRRLNRLRTIDTETGARDLFWEIRIDSQWIAHEAQNALPNTKANEAFPTLAEDGSTIIFARADSTSLGGYDLMSSRYVSSKGTIFEPVALGYPFNSPYNDYALLYDEELDLGLLISDRFCPDDTVVLYTFRGRPAALGGKAGGELLIDTPNARAILSLSGLPLSGANASTNKPVQESLYLPLKRGQVCRRWSDFESNQAIELYKQALSLEGQLSKLRGELRSLKKALHSNPKDEAAAQRVMELDHEIEQLDEQYHIKLVQAKNYEIQQRKLD